MDRMDPIQRMQELTAKLREYAAAYYEQDAPIVADA